MSKGRSSSYPERPLGGKRPRKPGEARKKPSFALIGGKRKPAFEIAGLVKPKREPGERLDVNLCVFGHRRARKFLSSNRGFKVPLHVWNKHGKTETA